MLGANVVFSGVTYVAFPIEVTGFGMKAKGELPRPTMNIANVAGTITALVLSFDDLVGAKVTRRRTFARYLDTQPGGAVNPDADPNAQYPPDVFYVNRKVSENKLSVQFELTTALDVDGLKLPRRNMNADTCGWSYRSAECSFALDSVIADGDNNVPPIEVLVWRGDYDPTAVYNYGDGVQVKGPNGNFVYLYLYPFSAAGVPVADVSHWFPDVCSLTLKGCRLRFDPNKTNLPLPFGGFPGVSSLPQV